MFYPRAFAFFFNLLQLNNNFHPPPPNESLLLPPLDSLYKAHVRNQELPQPGDSRPVMSPSQNAISKQMMKKWEPWETNMWKSNNSRLLQQLAFHTQQIIKVTSTQPTHSLNWKSLGFLSHIKRRTIGDRFPLSLWEVWFCSTLSVSFRH